MKQVNSTGSIEVSMKRKLRILVAEDEAVFRSGLSSMLTAEGHTVLEAEDGRVARDLLGIDEVDCVLSDINMPNMSGLALLRHAKEVRPQTPFIIMTGFSVLDETKQAHEMGADGFIAKPFRKPELLEQLSRLFKDEVIVSPEAVKPIREEDGYAQISIDEFISGRGIKYDIFVKLSDSKYIKVATSGENLSIDRIRAYKTKGLHFLYLRKADFEKYVELNVLLAKSISVTNKIDDEKRVTFLKHANEVVMQQLYFSQVSEKTFNDARTVVEATTSVCSRDQNLMGLLDSLNSHDNFLYAHCVGVSMYSVMIASGLGWTSPTIVQKLAMGGLLHDIGKKELDPGLLSKSRKDYNPQDVANYESHAVRGMNILSTIPTVPDEVLQIVLQHHEDCLGTGYPRKLTKNDIHPMAKVVAVADRFCSLAIRTANNEPMDPVLAVRRVINLNSNYLDVAALNALAKLFGVEKTSSLTA